jgi:hypothetical protein
LTFGLIHGHNEQVIFTTTMTAIIDQGTYGPSAFIRTEYNTQIVMSGSAPCVEWSFRIKELENWLTTLEEAMVNANNYGQRRGLEDIYFSLKAAHIKHEKQHQEVLTDAPTADDLMAYLTAYTSAMTK